MKKIILLAGLFFTAWFLSGCLKTLYPIFTEKDLVADPRLPGNWKKTKDGSTVTYRLANENELKVLSSTLQRHAGTIYIKEEKDAQGNIESTLYAFMVKLGKYYYMDYYPIGIKETEKAGDFFAAHYIPMHSIYRIKFTARNSFDLQQLDAGYLESLVKNKQIRIRHEIMDDSSFVITAPTKELQQYLIKYSDVPAAYNSDNSASYNRIN